MVLTLLGNDWKIGLKWKQNSVLSRRYGYEEEDIEIINFWGVTYGISIIYMLG